MFTSAVLTLILWFTSSANTYNVHKDMTIDELRRTFHVDSHHLVPEYEVVSVHHVRKRTIQESPDLNRVPGEGGPGGAGGGKRGEARLKFSAFGRPVDLNLVRTEGLFRKGKLKIWTVEPNATAQHGLEYMEMPETDEDIGEIYQDEANQAAILLRNDNETVVVEGSIGSDLIIRPLPERLRPKPEAVSRVDAGTGSANGTNANATSPSAYDDEQFLDTDGDLSSEVSIDTGKPLHMGKRKTAKASHVVFKRKQSEDDSMSDYAFMEPDHLAKRYRRSVSAGDEKKSRSKREAPYTIYPEILVIVDYDGYRLHGGDNLQIKRYFVSFWNGVDLRYKLLKGPKVRISIAGIIISRGRDATPYLERNRVGRDAIDSAAALTDMGKYLFRERRLPVYDIAVAITKLDMCRRSYPNDNCNRGTAGFAYVGGACVVNKRLEKVNSVAIIEDTGGFSGIIVAAHEVGHLLGAVHDGSPPPSYLGGPGAEKCQWTDGYIMSDLRHTERGFRWSPCSIQSFHHFLNGDTATCLFNAPHEDDSLPRVLPGKLLSLDAQCRRDRGTSACFKDDRVCAQLFCFDSASGYCVAYRPAAEGSTCGDGQYCLNGRCVAEHENIIPDYTQNTPSYIRGNNQGRPLFYDEEEDVYQQQNPVHPQTYTSPLGFQNIFQNDNPFYNQNYFGASATTQRTSNTPKSMATSSPTTPRRPFSLSTTRSPYDFKDFGRTHASSPTSSDQPSPTYSSPHPSSSSTPAPSPISRITPFAWRRSTKSPYDFADFGKSTRDSSHDDINNNYLKRSYNAASYYSDSNHAPSVARAGRRT